MSEKRFKLSSETVLQYQIMDNDTDLNESEVVGLLNEQQSKITELEIELTDCKNRKEQSEYNLRRENEQLRTQLMTALSYVPIETRVNMLGSLKR